MRCGVHMRDVELYLETEKLDVDFSHGARLLSRLTDSARKYAGTIELDTIRRSTGENEDTREGMVAGVKYLLKSLDREPWAWKILHRKVKCRIQETPETSRTPHGRMGQCL